MIFSHQSTSNSSQYRDRDIACRYERLHPTRARLSVSWANVCHTVPLEGDEYAVVHHAVDVIREFEIRRLWTLFQRPTLHFSKCLDDRGLPCGFPEIEKEIPVGRNFRVNGPALVMHPGNGATTTLERPCLARQADLFVANELARITARSHEKWIRAYYDDPVLRENIISLWEESRR